MNVFCFLLLVGLAAGTSTSSEEEGEIIPEAWIKDELKKYTSEHDIVNIFVPTNALCIRSDSDNTIESACIPTLFFVEGDCKEDDTCDSKGLFALKIETKEAIKLLDNGVDFTAAYNDNKVFFAATDGIYVFNTEKYTAEKYGLGTENIISIAKTNKGDVIYALTADKVLYKFTDNGKIQDKVDDVKNAQQIVLDINDHLYFYNSTISDSTKQLYVVNEEEVKKVDGLPGNAKKIKLFGSLYKKPTNHIIPVLIDDVKAYIIAQDGSVTDYRSKPPPKPLAFSAGTNVGIFFGYNKSIYGALYEKPLSIFITH